MKVIVKIKSKKHQLLTPAQVAHECGVSKSAVHNACSRQGRNGQTALNGVYPFAFELEDGPLMILVDDKYEAYRSNKQ